MATITITELATALDTDARTTRKFLRSITDADAQPGKGSRWAIEKREVRSLVSKFKKFTAANDQARLDRELAKQADQDAKVTSSQDDSDENIDFEEPTDEEILAAADFSDED